jgi:hypothetical protein
MNWCDHCAADPLSNQELEELGVDWVGNQTSGAQDVYVTLLHTRYTKGIMNKDIIF